MRALAVIGGLTPLVATWLVERTADELAPAYLIMVAAAVSFFAALAHEGDLPDAARLSERGRPKGAGASVAIRLNGHRYWPKGMPF